MNSLRQHLARGHLFGLLVVVSGVLLNRCLAPHLAVESRPLCLISGQLVAFAGLFILACTIKARADQRATTTTAPARIDGSLEP